MILYDEDDAYMEDGMAFELSQMGAGDDQREEPVVAEPVIPSSAESKEKNLNVTNITPGVKEGDQLQDLLDSGYSMEEIEDWKKTLRVKEQSEGGNNILNKKIQYLPFDCAKK